MSFFAFFRVLFYMALGICKNEESIYMYMYITTPLRGAKAREAHMKWKIMIRKIYFFAIYLSWNAAHTLSISGYLLLSRFSCFLYVTHIDSLKSSYIDDDDLSCKALSNIKQLYHLVEWELFDIVEWGLVLNV